MPHMLCTYVLVVKAFATKACEFYIPGSNPTSAFGIYLGLRWRSAPRTFKGAFPLVRFWTRAAVLRLGSLFFCYNSFSMKRFH